MARIETDPNYSSPTFSRATAATDAFKKEDVQNLAAAMSTHDHSSGKGVAIAAGAIGTGVITSAMIANGTIVAADIAAGTITSNEIADGTIATADLANAAVTNAKLASDTARANLLVNGGFEVWQRGTAFVATGAWTADRWQMTIAGSDAFSVSRDSANADAGSTYCAFLSFTLGTGAGVTRISQPMSVADHPYIRGRTFTLSVRIKATIASGVRGGIGSDGSGGTTAFSSYHSGSGAYETLTVSYTVPSNATSMSVSVFCAAGSTAAFYVDSAMLVVGSQAADYAPPHPADDWARCLRYYEIIGGSSNIYIGSGLATSTTAFVAQIPFKVRKPVTPTITVSAASAFSVFNAGGGVIAATALASAGTDLNNVSLSGSVASGLVGGNGTVLLSNASLGTLTVEANP